MHMIDVMKKLQEIAEAGYDNEDIQRGIDAAGKHVVEKNVEPIIEAQSPAQKAAFQKMLDAKKGDKPEAEDEDEEEAVEEAVEAVEEDADDGVEEVHEDEVVDETVEAVEEGGFNKDGSYQTSDDEANEFDDEDDDSEEIATETVEINVNELAELMQLAGYTNYAEKVEEYANEPEAEYMSAEEQLIGLSGGLNGPKKMYPAAAGGDNPMDQEPREVTESTFDTFYAKYDKFVAELKDSE